MIRVSAIALNTYREAVRDKVLYGLLVCTIAVLFVSVALGELALHEEERVVYDIGMAAISLFSIVLAVFLGSSLLYKEIHRKTLYVILPKPVTRGEFLLGKYAGIVLTALVFVAFAGTVKLMVASLQSGESVGGSLGLTLGLAIFLAVGLWKAPDRSQYTALWAAVAVVLSLWNYGENGLPMMVALAQLLLCVAEVMTLTAVAVFFSAFSTPFLTGLLSIGVWLVGRSAYGMESLPQDVVGPNLTAFLDLLATVVPNFNLFAPGRYALTESVAGYGGAAGYVGTAFLYSAIYAAILLFLAALVFRRRDFL